ncbi:Cystathionine beta-synthase [Teratosphaeria destructans]|uniref:Cystathionine beta-synthase n=1 Tax=Teratosphaeria destructans TaxID=418781 RepID=A0A9W7SYP7_9PEZI|nr:Cystathionine beta-synthase [Teratosphaeria destructans]
MANSAAPASTGNAPETAPSPTLQSNGSSPWASKYRGATVEDLDPPPALSTSPSSPVSAALMAGLERDYTHLTVIHPHDKSLLGYLSIPRLRHLLETRQVREDEPVEKAMVTFQRKGRKYRLITLETPLEELEAFFDGDGVVGRQDFAVVTDPRGA